jgi:hypothetical protein
VGERHVSGEHGVRRCGAVRMVDGRGARGEGRLRGRTRMKRGGEVAQCALFGEPTVSMLTIETLSDG